MSGGLDNGCRVNVRWSAYVSPSGGNQRVIWMSGVCPGMNTQRTDVYPDIDARLESSKN